ncbi:amino acid ABC transporter ATP-binding protein [Pseudomonas sp. CCC3.1]|nr:amino acid ABC transporter ATP-binding protein [Pseudomonas sp. CCC3.1]MEB0205175.1 amino acid ABC transporter ATP-binding protein [Pseudomonas sp. CCC3.1]WPX38433.1 amino acid ABC transporter ATP-binding protein [Pseudomonas sp. CCC3.1]
MSVDRGEVISLIGPSGSGKSTLLRVLMGLLPPTSGQVLIDDEPLDYVSKKSLRAARDKMAIVFQQYNLFQNMDVLRNVTVAPTKVKKRPLADVEVEAKALLTKVGLGEKYHAYPDELSGGQQQRVAIARALALRPQILLLDEVTAALDPELVNEVLDTVRALAREGITMLLVSHEMSFVREVSTRIVMMDKGQVVEIGTPKQIFEAPVEARTREFVGKILRH